MSPEEHRELFAKGLGPWLIKNGVLYPPFAGLFGPPVKADLYPAELEDGLKELIRAFGGDV